MHTEEGTLPEKHPQPLFIATFKLVNSPTLPIHKHINDRTSLVKFSVKSIST